MASKLQAVKNSVDSGITAHIAHGRKPERLSGILAGEKGLSTCFSARSGK